MGVRGLLFRHGAYYARLVIPVELRPALDGKTEFRERLGSDRVKAERDSHAAMAGFHKRVAEARRTLTPASPAPDVRMTLSDMARAHYAEALASDDDERAANSRGFPGAPREWREPYRAMLRSVASRRASDEEIGATIGWALDGFARWGTTKAQPGTKEWRRLGQTLAAVQLDAMEREAERDKGNFDGAPRLTVLDPVKVPPTEVPADAARVRGPESLLPLNQIVTLMHREKSNIRPSTHEEQRIAVRYFEEFLGEPLPIHAITRRHILRYKDALPKVPVKYASRFPGKTLPEAIEANAKRSDPYPTLAAITINNKWLTHLKSLFRWAAANDYVPDDPARGVRLNLGKADAEPTRIAFSIGDLATILAIPVFDPPSSEREWAVVIAMHTGMRVGEMAQLRLDGILKERGTLVFTISGDVKNNGSRRLVPVHSELLKRGLAERIESLKAAGKVHLFPEWIAKAQARLAFAKASGKVIQSPFADIHAHWFITSVLRQAGVTDRRKTFHSIRHTFKTELSRAGVTREISDALTGHSDASAGAKYVHAAPIEAMAAAVEQLDFTAAPQ